VDFGKAGGVGELAVDFVFVTKLRASSTMLLELNRHLLSASSNPQINITERTTTDSFSYTVIIYQRSRHYIYKLILLQIEEGEEGEGGRGGGGGGGGDAR